MSLKKPKEAAAASEAPANKGRLITMKIKAFFAILCCKALRLAARVLRRGGTAMPGRYALKICPELLSYLSRDVSTVIITGTNGKTTGAAMIEQILAANGYDVFTNRSGANLISGITTEFVMNANLLGKPRKHYAVMECDEAATVKVVSQTRAKVFVVNNIFSDQEDRYGGVKKTAELIRTAAEQMPETLLVLNADCSLTSSLSKLPNKKYYFGIGAGVLPEHGRPEHMDAPDCIFCGSEYEYSYFTYDHLGGFVCPKCGYKRIVPDFEVSLLKEFRTDGSKVLLNTPNGEVEMDIHLPAAYNVYNAAAAAATGYAMGIAPEESVLALAEFSNCFGRMEKLNLGKNGAEMLLVKNPAGCNQVIDFLQRIEETFDIVIAFNAHVSDGTDISWIDSCNFEALSDMGDRIERYYISGEKAAELKTRILSAGVSEEKIVVETSYDKLVDVLNKNEKPIYLLPNYTVMLDFRQVIVRRCGGRDFWN